MNAVPELLTTDRLVATRTVLADFDSLCRLHRDPAVMRTLSADGNIQSDEVTLARLNQAIDHWREHGFGFWIFRRHDTGDFIGRGGLKYYDIDGRREIGLAYAVLSGHWGRGFATEMAAASLGVGFDALEADNIASWTLKENHASRRVMQKLGFVFEREIVFAGLPHRFYRLAVEAWRGRPQS